MVPKCATVDEIKKALYIYIQSIYKFAFLDGGRYQAVVAAGTEQ
jgi:hypothetical protein